jgi:hypothetical protein
MENPTAQPAMQTGAASYPPAYQAPSQVIGRAYDRYIHARVLRDAALGNLSRAVIDSAIRRVEREA